MTNLESSNKTALLFRKYCNG